MILSKTKTQNSKGVSSEYEYRQKYQDLLDKAQNECPLIGGRFELFFSFFLLKSHFF